MELLIIIAIIIIFLIIIIRQDRSDINKRADQTREKRVAIKKSSGITVSKQISCVKNRYALLIDETNRQWVFIDNIVNKTIKLHFTDLIEYEVTEDDKSIIEGRVGSALVGGMLFGSIGAVAGSARKKAVVKTCNSVKVKIVVNDMSSPQIVIPLLSSPAQTPSSAYNKAIEEAENIIAILGIIKHRAELEIHSIQTNNQHFPKKNISSEIPKVRSSKKGNLNLNNKKEYSNELTKLHTAILAVIKKRTEEMKIIEKTEHNITLNKSYTDELIELHSLMQKGIITNEEFQAKKKQILGL